MGFIKDGTVSGIIPENVVFAVHYPGYPSSTSRAVETLGGLEEILKVRTMQSQLKLHFRPEDPYSHPAFGDLRPCSNLLLKISKKRVGEGHEAVVSKCMSGSTLTETEVLESATCNIETVKNKLESSVTNSGSKGNPPQSEDSAMLEHLSTDIVARVQEAFHFSGMVDYQHVLAVHAHNNKRRKRNKDEEDEKDGFMDINQDDVMMLVPPLFSTKDVPEKQALKPPFTMSSKKKQEAIVKQRWEMQIEPCIAIDFNIQEIPRKINWEDHIPRGSDHWEWQMAVSKLFDERPIWHARSLNHCLADKGLTPAVHTFKRLMLRSAYYFSTGPYRRFWIRKGYDPRKDPESRIYQTIDFRVPPSIRGYTDSNTMDESGHRWKDICAFRVFPSKYQTSLQLFELDDDYIQEEIRKPPEKTCSCSTGWLSPHVHLCLKLRIFVRFLSVYPNVGAENILKKASTRFEKFRKGHVLRGDFSSKEVEHQHKEPSFHISKISLLKPNDTDLVHDDDRDGSDDDEDNNGRYDEIEEDEEEDEEELDDFEPYQLDADDGDFTLDPSYPVGENISKNYLQDLFGSFSSTKAGTIQDQDVELSDGEYQIFEQDDDDDDDANFSDFDY